MTYRIVPLRDPVGISATSIEAPIDGHERSVVHQRAVIAIGPIAADVAWESIQGDGFWTAIARRRGICVEASGANEREALAVAWARLLEAENRAIDELAWKGACAE